MLDRGSRVGSYEIQEFLGHGQSVVTYRALHTRTGRPVALKIPHPTLAADTTFYFRFCREAALCARLHHPNIVRVVESGEEGDDLFIAMELIDGVALDNLLARSGPLELIRSLTIARQIAEALDHANSAGVVHRNIKPGHVMVMADDTVKILDFGVARDYGQVGLTSGNVFLGTPQYSAPESSDPTSLDHASDLYSLGIVLFEMLQGRPPFEAVSPVELMMKHVNEPFPSLASLEVRIPQAVWDLMDRLCRKDREQRPRSGAVVAKEIDRIIELLSRVRRH